MATIDDFGNTTDPLGLPALGGPTGWAAAVRDFIAGLPGDIAGVASDLDGHVQAVDPHPQYLTEGEGDVRYALISTPGVGAAREFLASELSTAPPDGAVYIESIGGAGRTFRVSKVDADGQPYNLSPLLPGDTITLTDDPETPPITGWARYGVTTDVTDQTTYWQFNVVRTDTSGSQTVPDGTRIRFIPTLAAGGGGVSKEYVDEIVTVDTVAPTEAPTRDGLLWVVIP